jgi:hypothetical protein
MTGINVEYSLVLSLRLSEEFLYAVNQQKQASVGKGHTQHVDADCGK